MKPFHQWIQEADELNPGLDPSVHAEAYRQTFGRGPNEDDYRGWAAQAREMNPGVEVPDEVLRQQYTQTYGEPDPAPSDWSNAWADAWSEAKGIGGGLVGLAGQTLGLDGMRDWGMGAYQRNMADVEARQRPQYGIDYLMEDGTLGDWVDAAQYHVTKGIPSLIGGLGAGLLGKAALKQGVKTAVKGATEKTLERAGTAGFLGGVGAYSTGQELGQIYPEAVREMQSRGKTADDVDLAKVYGYGALAGGVETAADVAMLGMAGFTRLAPALAKMTNFTRTGSIPARVAKIAGAGMATEGAEELAQTPLEYLGADRQLGTPEFWAEERQAGFAGILGGLGASVVTAPMNILSTPRIQDGQPTDLTSPPDNTPPVTPDQPQADTPFLTPSQLLAERNGILIARGMAARAGRGEDLVSRPTQVTPPVTPGGAPRSLTVPSAKIAEAKPAKPPTKRELADQANAQMRQVILEQLSSGARSMFPTNAKGEVTLIPASIRKLHSTLSQLEARLQSQDPVERQAARTEAQAWLAEFDKKVGKEASNSEETPKFAAPRDELVATFRFNNGLMSEEPTVVERYNQLTGDPQTRAQQVADEFGIPYAEVYNTLAGVQETSTPATGTTTGKTGPVVQEAQDTGTEPATQIATVGQADNALADIGRRLVANTPNLSEAEAAAIGLQFGFDGVPGIEVDPLRRGALTLQEISDALKAAGYTKGKSDTANRETARKTIQRGLNKIRVANSGNRELVKNLISKASALRNEADNLVDDSEQIGALTQQEAADELNTASTNLTIRSGTGGVNQVGLTTSGDRTQVGSLTDDVEIQARLRQEAEAAAKAEIEFEARVAANSALAQQRQDVDVLLPDPAQAQANQALLQARDAKTRERWAMIQSVVPGLSTFDAAPKEVQDTFADFVALAEDAPAQLRQSYYLDAARYLQKEVVGANLAAESAEARGVLPRTEGGAQESPQVPTTVSTSGSAEGTRAGGRAGADVAITTKRRRLPRDTGEPQAQPNDGYQNLGPEAAQAQAQNPEGLSPEIGELKTKYGEAQATQPTTRQAFTQALTDLLGLANNWRVHLYDTAEQAQQAGIPETKLGGTSGRGAYGWVETINGKTHATFILENIQAGTEMSKVLHELGAHIGLESDPKKSAWLQRQVEQWASRDDGSIEAEVGKAALARVEQAKTTSAQRLSEIVAYTLEEASARGIDPTAANLKTPLGRWLHTVWTQVKAALRRAGILDPSKLTAQDLVNLAYGAARLELNGVPSSVEQTGEFSQIRYGEPGWAPTRVIQDNINKLPGPLQDTTKAIVETAKAAARKTHLGLASTKELADYISDKAAPFKGVVKEYMANVQAAKIERTTRDKVASDILARYHALKLKPVQKSVADFLAEARIEEKWGYDPQVATAANPEPWLPAGYQKGERVTVDPAMAEAFGRLTPAAQRVVVDINKTLSDNFRTTQELIEKNVVGAYDKRIAQTDEALAEAVKAHATASDVEAAEKVIKRLEKRLAALKADKESTLKSYGKRLIAVKAPYAPLKRDGKYVVQAHSNELKALYDKGENRTAEENKRYNTLRRDENHYRLEFVNSRFEIEQRKRVLAETFGENVDAWEKTSWRENTFVGLPEIDRLRSLVQEGVVDDSAAKLSRAVEKLALQVMVDTHARQSQHQAKKIPGYDPDMVRSFISQARADAHNLANLKYLSEINDAIQRMTRMVEDKNVRTKTDLTRDELGNMVSELHQRWGDTLKYQPSPVVDRLAAFSSTWHLLLSPAYYFQNATQVGMMSVPWMAGTHGWTRTQQAVLRAYRDILPMVKDKAASWEHFNTELVPEDVRAVIKSLELSGQINIFMDLELGQAAATGDGVGAKVGRMFDQTVRRLPAKMETINRVVTAIAAYRLAVEKENNVAKATEYAGKVIDTTHGDYDGFNTPRWISPGKWGPTAKLVFQFRKFQLIQLAFYARMLNDMTASHPPEVRKAAAKALGFSLAHTTAMAGTLGLPGLMTAQFLASLLGGGDDDPDDKDAQDFRLRKALIDGGMSPGLVDVVLGGLPTLVGVDMTGKLGAQTLLSPLPYTEIAPRKQGNFQTIVADSLGPTVGLADKFYRAFGDFQRGDYYAALEKVMPAGVGGDTVQAIRLMDKGERTYNSDQAFSPEELGLATAIVAGLGFTPEILSKRWTKLRVQKSYEGTFDQRTTDIKRAYSAAVNDGASRKEIRRIKAEWMDLQKAKKAAGFQDAGLGPLLRAPMEQRKRERQTLGGVKYDRGNRRFVEEINRVLN